MNFVILAAGMGKRMHSRLPKVLQPLAGRPMLDHVLDATEGFSESPRVVVVGQQVDGGTCPTTDNRSMAASEKELMLDSV